MTQGTALPVKRAGAWLAAPANAAFVVLAVVVALAYLALAWDQVHYGLEYDEAYLLTVVRNIAQGNGFVDDGVTFATSGTAFDPRISTGPVLLLPSAAVWALSGESLALTRLVPVAFFALLLAATAWLYARWGGRWAAVAAVAGPLLLPVLEPDLTSRSLVPGRFVGEIAATSLLVLATALLLRRNYFWAGLTAGLSIQVKLNFALPVLVLLAAWAVVTWFSERGDVPRLLLRFVPGLLLPTLAFEAYKAVTLGLDGYRVHLGLLREFGDAQSMTLDVARATLPEKLTGIAQVVAVPALIVAGVAVLTLVAVAVAEPYLRREQLVTDDQRRRHRAWLAFVCLAAAALSLGLWWLARTPQTSPRPLLPVMLVLLPLATATALLAARRWRRSAAASLRPVATGWLGLVYAVLLVSVAAQGLRIAANDSGQQLLSSQLRAAGLIEQASPRLPIDGYWTNPEFSFLTDVPFEREWDVSATVQVFTSVRALIEQGTPDASVFEPRCGEVLLRTRDVLVCTPRDAGPLG